MNRVLVTGGAGTVGAAVVRRLLSDPDYEVRVSDPREAPTWMREGCEVHRGDLRTLGEARKAIAGCSHVIHLAALTDEGARPHTLVEVNNALYNAVVRAALDEDVARFVYGSSSAAVRLPESAYGFSKLTGEVYCRTAHEEHGLPFTICRPWDIYGPGEPFDVLRRAQVVMRPLPLPGADAEPRWPLHVDDAAAGIVAALSHPEALNEERLRGRAGGAGRAGAAVLGGVRERPDGPRAARGHGVGRRPPGGRQDALAARVGAGRRAARGAGGDAPGASRAGPDPDLSAALGVPSQPA